METTTTASGPPSTHRDYDGFYYEDLACNQNGSYSFEGNVGFIEGKISYTCQAEFEPALVQTYDIWNYGMFEGLNPDGSYIGSYLGQSYNARALDDGDYRMVATEGSWRDALPPRFLAINQLFVLRRKSDDGRLHWENLNIIENRFIANDPSDPAAIHLNGGEVFYRDFSYEMAKFTLTYTISGATPAETLLDVSRNQRRRRRRHRSSHVRALVYGRDGRRGDR